MNLFYLSVNNTVYSWIKSLPKKRLLDTFTQLLLHCKFLIYIMFDVYNKLLQYNVCVYNVVLVVLNVCLILFIIRIVILNCRKISTFQIIL